MTRKEAILRYLSETGSITPIEAFRELGITKLATVISEMRRYDGIEFRIEKIPYVTRYGSKIAYCRYSLKKGES